MAMNSFTELVVWQKAMDLVVNVYQLTDTFPKDQRFVLSAQTQKSAISIPSNVAEGFCRKTTPTFLNHVNIALGSSCSLNWN